MPYSYKSRSVSQREYVVLYRCHIQAKGRGRLQNSQQVCRELVLVRLRVGEAEVTVELVMDITIIHLELHNVQLDVQFYITS
ncbi:hypothetical protein CY34DRAFT_163242 [Suillus luteus UH-Slu-Lm8-n1]|uniref:Unplaced genomic scaffold CY34scaffold_117, whole genome shotgun sequence n=1 Tax=Suillus luteus UH-Slu-Lm8-n1 TaxID=930992 RepID=A0A0D0AW87_9AGAM|nr:hypothetical protein CY34DRAFT_163242 [Suillus luteus UH-Slu-Lm8-n1]